MTQATSHPRQRFGQRFVRLCLRAPDPRALAEFYCGALGMRAFSGNASITLGYDEEQCLLELRKATSGYTPGAHDLYWKMGLTVSDLDSAYEYLCGQNVAVSAPSQFRDVGYMCHLRDPQGFSVELLQHGFEGDATTFYGDHRIGAQATLAHITLRVTDIESAQHFCEAGLGLSKLSVQPVTDAGFTLYFYAWSTEKPPHAGLETIANRPWLWRRPYALLELQHLETSTPPLNRPLQESAGFAGVAHRGRRDGTVEYLTVEDFDALK